MSKLWLVRHGPTHAKSMIGWTDLPADLSDTAQIDRLKSYLPDAPVISSDLTRAVTTADALQGTRIRLPHNARLREIHFGAWEGLTFKEANDRDPEALSDFWERPGPSRAPGGESWNALQSRVDAAVTELIAEHSELIIVAHFGAILTQIQRAVGLSPEAVFAHKIDNFSVTHVDLDAGRALAINHLP
ncbi:MAG: histidine phosphatase family protein [Pseudomonadota bacterium]